MPERRGTRQHRAIRRVLDRAGGPLSPQEVHEAARREVPGLGLATVYRALRRLEEAGWIEPVPVAGGGLRYERTGRNHHHHFRCDRCDRLFDLEGCRLPADLGLATPPGFRPKRHEVLVHGTCPACRADERRSG
jgi:Fur family ferric uptake transcriptional regulator